MNAYDAEDSNTCHYTNFCWSEEMRWCIISEAFDPSSDIGVAAHTGKDEQTLYKRGA
jgi:hypothetical protein